MNISLYVKQLRIITQFNNSDPYIQPVLTNNAYSEKPAANANNY